MLRLLSLSMAFLLLCSISAVRGSGVFDPYGLDTESASSVRARSPSFPGSELDDASALAKPIGDRDPLDELADDVADYEDCCGGCDSCGGCCQKKLLGLIVHSDNAFRNFISPQTNPLFFEDPRALTEARFHFVNHIIPENQPALQGGDVQFWALQLRFALSERLSIIANKDGYINHHIDNPAFGAQDGWADVAAGLKYAFYRNPCCQEIISAGFTYEIDMGRHEVLQGRGDGEFHFFLTGGKEILPCVHWLSATGFRIPTDHTARSQMWYWSNHIDRQICRDLFAVLEVNWFHWMRSGEALGANFEGGDLYNLGSNDVAGNDIVTMGIGTRYRPTCDTSLGVAWEFPLTNRRDILHDRLYFDFILRY